MNKQLLTLAGSLILSSTSSSAALLLTFTEESGNVIMRASGSVDVSNGTFAWDHTLSGTSPKEGRVSDTHAIAREFTSPGITQESTTGIDLLPGDFTSSSYLGTISSGAGWFHVENNFFISYSNSDTGVIDNNLKSATITTSNAEVTFTSQTFASMGLTNHALDTTIDLWGARVGATDAEKVQFRVQTASVPEPSSTALLGLGTLGLLARRNRD